MTDNFFDLGGHSLTVVQALSLVRESFQIELPLITLFESPTIAEFAPFLENILWSRQPTKQHQRLETTCEQVEGEL